MTCGFNIQHYQDTINSFLDSGYHIDPISSYFHNGEYDGKQILLRHDVDLSLDYALEMALLEKDIGIHSTYYIMLHSPLYSATSPEGRDKIKAIKKANHDVALHIDPRYYLGTIEFSILEHIVESTVFSWCQHLITMTEQLNLPRDAANIPYKYLSDSAMYWREGCWHKHINKYDKLQILIHPEWTFCDPKGLLNKWQIIDKIEQEARNHTTKSFSDFRCIVYETPPLPMTVPTIPFSGV